MTVARRQRGRLGRRRTPGWCLRAGGSSVTGDVPAATRLCRGRWSAGHARGPASSQTSPVGRSLRADGLGGRERPGDVEPPDALQPRSPFPFQRHPCRRRTSRGDGAPRSPRHDRMQPSATPRRRMRGLRATGGRMPTNLRRAASSTGRQRPRNSAYRREITRSAWGAPRRTDLVRRARYGPRALVLPPSTRGPDVPPLGARRWRTVLRRKLQPRHDNFLGQRPVPAP